MSRRTIVVIVVVVVFGWSIVDAVNRRFNPAPQPMPVPTARPVERTVHIDGRDLNGDMLPRGAPLFSKPYMEGERLAWLQHGDAVTLIESNGYTARIRTSSGVEGWVEDYFVQELRDPAIPL
jgi:hypothetical protein